VKSNDIGTIFFLQRGELDETVTITVSPSAPPPYYCAPVAPLSFLVPGFESAFPNYMSTRWAELAHGDYIPPDAIALSNGKKIQP